MARLLTDYYTVAEAAAKIGVTPGRVRQLHLAGQFPGSRRIGPITVIPRREVDGFQRQPRGRPKSPQS